MSTFAPARAPRAQGIIGHQSHATYTVLVGRYGIPTADAAATWFALATLLDRDDLVAVGDSLILDPEVLDLDDPRPYTTVDALRAQLSGSPRRGAAVAASAIRLIRQGAASRPETLLRLLLGRAGLPRPLLNIDVTDDAGKWLGRADLVYPQWRTIVEYDGDQHRTSTTQYDRDITRIENFVHAGWNVVRVRSRGLFRDQLDTVARVERALRAGGWRA